MRLRIKSSGLWAALLAALIGSVPAVAAERLGLSDELGALAQPISCDVPVAKVVLNYLIDDNKVYSDIKVFPTVFSSCVKTVLSGAIPKSYLPVPSLSCREEIKDADAATFRYQQDFPLVGKDKSAVFISGHHDETLDAASFEWLRDMKMFTDKNGTYAADRQYNAAPDKEIILKIIDNKHFGTNNCDELKSLHLDISLSKQKGVNPSQPNTTMTLEQNGWVAVQ